MIMKCPNLKQEKKLWRAGYKTVVGIDEAGRGPLAGPVVAGAVYIKEIKVLDKILRMVKDSKKLSQRQREEIYEIAKNHPQVKWGIGVVSEKVIDKINILEATKLAMKKAIRNLKPNFLLIDGNFKLDLDIAQKSIIRGDEKVLSCSLASIFAKVERDRLMEKMHKKYPQYGFDKHKGYGTRFHMEMLKKNGPCKIHRETFAPVRLFA
jgi:ribonuclease HII